MNEHLSKPIDPDALYRLLVKYPDRAQLKLSAGLYKRGKTWYSKYTCA